MHRLVVPALILAALASIASLVAGDRAKQERVETVRAARCFRVCEEHGGLEYVVEVNAGFGPDNHVCLCSDNTQVPVS